MILFVGYIWFSTVMKSCGSSSTTEAIADLTESDEEAIFKADEDSGDDGYILEDNEEVEDDFVKDDNDGDADIADDQEEFAYVADDQDEEDFVEKSPEKTIRRAAISETTYSSSDNADFLVIAGSFANETNADRMVQKLIDMGYSNTEKVVFDFSQYYSVVTGKHDSESNARDMSLELKNQNINAYVHKMRSKFYGD